MDDARKNAYRYLLYWAMLDIRQIAWLRPRWWNPFSVAKELRRARLAGSIADCMHNLAMFAAYDFDRFEEDWFWPELEDLQKRYPDFDSARYRNRFESRLSEEEESV